MTPQELEVEEDGFDAYEPELGPACDVRKVWAPKLIEIEKKLEKVNRVAAKLGTAPAKLVVHNRRTEVRQFSTDMGEERLDSRVPYAIVRDPRTGKNIIEAMIEYAEVSVFGIAPKLSGWTLAACTEALPNGKVVLNVVPGKDIPASFRSRNIRECDHCGKDRHRTETFIVQHDNGDYKMVGRNCLRDFLGHQDPKNLIQWAEGFTTIIQALGGSDSEFFGGSGGEHALKLADLVAASSAAVKAYGFTGSKAAEEQRRTSTAEVVGTHFFPPNTKGWVNPYPLEVVDADSVRAGEVIAWVAGLDEGVSSYYDNLKAIFSLPLVRGKHWGYAVSAVQAYLKDNGLGEARKNEWADKVAASAYLGVVGEKIKFSGKVIELRSFDSDFGPRCLVKLETSEGQTLVWWTSGATVIPETGVVSELEAKVKSHQDYKGLKQTVVTRVKAVVANKAKAVKVKA